MSITKYEVVVIETAPDYFVVKCGSCNGAGCSACGHVGSRKLTVPADWKNEDVGIVKCGNCDGRGCPACDHIGSYVGRYPRVTCGGCNGIGCSACNYRGTVWAGCLR
jgi:hypothetical protein